VRTIPITLLAFHVVAVSAWAATETINVADFGVQPNSYDNNPKTCAILMEDFQGLTIDGSGSEFVFHGRMQPLTVERCERATIRNLTIDGDIPLTARGGVSLLDERWDSGGNILSAESAVIVGDPYVMTIHLPEGFRLESAEVDGEKVEFANQKEIATARIVPSATKTVNWKIDFAK